MRKNSSEPCQKPQNTISRFNGVPKKYKTNREAIRWLKSREASIKFIGKRTCEIYIGNRKVVGASVLQTVNRAIKLEEKEKRKNEDS